MNKEAREYKSNVFSMLMENPQNALSVYNALNGTNYDDVNAVEIKRLDGATELSVRNDAAFVIGSVLNLYEHQSTVNPNMPVRFLIYFSNTIQEYMQTFDIYGPKKLMIPSPRFVVFYNGIKDAPEKYELKLSDSFISKEEQPEIELKCTVYNINTGYNSKLINNCGILKEYMQFVDYVRMYMESGSVGNFTERITEAVNKAIKRCLEEGILVELLTKREKEVLGSMALDYTFERRYELGVSEARKDGILEGRTEGETIGRINAIFELLEDFGPIPEKITTAIRSIEDPIELSRLLKLAAKSSSIEAFLEAME